MPKFDLTQGWLVRYEELAASADMAPVVSGKTGGWMGADLPCDVHMPLLANGLIPEPLEGDNCFKCEWTDGKSWWFRKTFEADGAFVSAERAELVLEGLDAHSDIFLNGVHIGHHISAFYPFVKDIKEFISPGENELLIRVTSGIENINEADMADLQHFLPAAELYNRGERRRPFVRKPQFSYGWDWGPRVPTCGITGRAWIELAEKLRVNSVHVYTKSVGDPANVEIEVELENLHPFSTLEGSLTVELLYGDRAVYTYARGVVLNSGLNFADVGAVVDEPKLWWPNGMGEQNLYTVKVSAAAGGIIARYPEFRFGIRTLRLRQDELGGGERSFMFEVNGAPVFCKGGDWVPADAIPARVTSEKYSALVREAKEANFNMLRVWGGGLYEPDVFYEKCDECGILIWHDFMFACSLYPDFQKWFRREAEAEIDYQTKRLRNHPSMALWSGNNENTWGFADWWPSDTTKGGALCYNYIAPAAVRRNCPDIPYWNSSPYGGERPNCEEAGDCHYWGEAYMNPSLDARVVPEKFDGVRSKFVSEYGYVGPCKRSSVEKYLGGADMRPDGSVWQMHTNRFEQGTVPVGVTAHYTDAEKLGIDQYLLYAGLVQGVMYGYSLESLRSRGQCGGALFWMYDDCWGENGWTVIDYYLTRKISYYFVKRALAPVKLILREKDGVISVTGINETADTLGVRAECGYVSFDGAMRGFESVELTLEPRSRRVIYQFAKQDYDCTAGVYFVRPDGDLPGLLPATLRRGNTRELHLTQPNLHISEFEQSGGDILFTVSSDKFAHAVHFGLADDLRLSDEYFDLLPGENRRVRVYNAADRVGREQLTAKSVL